MRFNNEVIEVSDYIKKLKQNGDEIGLHGSYKSYDDVALFKSQKNTIEEIIGEPVHSTRQHYLHFDIRKTPSIHIAANIKTDSTLGFNTTVGFRTGTSFPFYIQNETGFLLEIPLLIMDGALYFDSNKTMEKGMTEVLRIINFVEEVKGCLTINFHPDYFILPKYFKTYEYILKTLSERNCTFMTMNEVRQTIENVCAE